jgi:hypothetical protein
MINEVIAALVRRLWGQKIKAEAEQKAREIDQRAGDYVAMRYTRGNVAIQQGRFDIGKPKS